MRTVKTTNDTAFDEFWAAYPRHDGKVAAKRKWDRLHLKPEEIGAIHQALGWQVPRWRDPDFIPHASTYLHNRRWEDEPPRKVNGHAPTFAEWSCPHVQECASKFRCDQATVLGRPRKVLA